MTRGGSRANEKAGRQEQREEWVKMLKHFPIGDAREKHAVEVVLCLHNQPCQKGGLGVGDRSQEHHRKVGRSQVSWRRN